MTPFRGDAKTRCFATTKHASKVMVSRAGII